MSNKIHCYHNIMTMKKKKNGVLWAHNEILNYYSSKFRKKKSICIPTRGQSSFPGSHSGHINFYFHLTCPSLTSVCFSLPVVSSSFCAYTALSSFSMVWLKWIWEYLSNLIPLGDPLLPFCTYQDITQLIGGGRGIINKNQKKDNYFATLKPMHVLQQTLTICKHDWQTNTFHQFSDNNFNSLKHTSNASDNKAPSASQIRG